MAIIGAILGDIAGSRFEYSDKVDDYDTVTIFTDECFFTDDTVLTLATKFAVDNLIDYADAYKKFYNIYPDRGYGDRFTRWAKQDNHMSSHSSFGNGSAMRVSPLVNKVDQIGTVVMNAWKSSICTHNHPEAIKGAMVTAACMCMARDGADKTEIEKFATENYPIEQYRFSVAVPLDKMRDICVYDVTSQGSVPVAIRCFLDSEDYESFIRNVLSLNCDVDTICAIGGGIAEEYYKETGFDDRALLRKYLDDFLYQTLFDYSG